MSEDSMHASLDAALARNSGPSAEDVEALALLISCTEIAQDEHGDGGTLMYEPARRLAAALLASDWLAAHTAAAEVRGAERGARAVVEAVEQAHAVDRGVDDSCPWLIQFCPEVLAAREAAARVGGEA